MHKPLASASLKGPVWGQAGSAKRKTKVQGPMKRRLGPQSLVIALHPDRFKDTPFESVLNQVTQKLNARRDELAGRI